MIRGFDTYKGEKFGHLRVPKLEGYIKLTLHNCRTGKNEVVEGKNIVTNAVRDIFANNQFSAVDAGSMMPLWEKWYGGILCYASIHPADGQGNIDPDNYIPRADSVNHLTAHAGQTAIDVDHDDDFTRGNPTKSAYIKTDNSIKQVFEWGTTHGNGVISALSLTHSDTGSYGLGNNGYHFKNTFNPFAQVGSIPSVAVGIGSVNNSFARYDDSHALAFAIGHDGDYAYGNVRFNTNYITVYIRKLPFFKTSLYETLNLSTQFQRSFEVECTHTFRCMPSYYFDPTTKYLWLFDNITGFSYDNPSWDKDDMSYVVIDCENEEIVTEGTIHSDAEDLAPSAVSNQNYRDGNSSVHRFAQVIVEDGYVYLPMSTGTISGGGWLNEFNINMTGYKKINLSSQADQTALTFNETFPMHESAIKTGDFIISSGRVMNGAVGYSCAEQFSHPWGAGYAGVYAFQDINKSSFMAMPIGTGSSGTSTMGRLLLANKLVNTTMFNLDSSVEKNASKSMTIEYTLTEVSENNE